MLQRKSLRLPNYDYGQSGAYFVTICTKEKRPVLSSIVGAADLCGPRSHLTAWGTVVEKYLRGIPGIEQYVIMPNHLHMIFFIRQTLGGPQGSAAPTRSGQKIKIGIVFFIVNSLLRPRGDNMRSLAAKELLP